MFENRRSGSCRSRMRSCPPENAGLLVIGSSNQLHPPNGKLGELPNRVASAHSTRVSTRKAQSRRYLLFQYHERRRATTSSASIFCSAPNRLGQGIRRRVQTSTKPRKAATRPIVRSSAVHQRKPSCR